MADWATAYRHDGEVSLFDETASMVVRSPAKPPCSSMDTERLQARRTIESR
jgi:hypothetical protein